MLTLIAPAMTQNVEATMTKGDHMAAKQIPRAPRPAGMPVAPGLTHGAGEQR